VKIWKKPEGRILHGDCLSVMRSMPAGYCDLVFGSPPYSKARQYLENGKDLGIARNVGEWVEWMVGVYREAVRVCKGLVAFVVGPGETENYRWNGAPALLYARLIAEGFHVRDPHVYKRHGIMGSGGPDDMRRDFEWVVRVTAQPGKLPWSNNKACGHPPKYGPGGNPSYRGKSGQRVNQWGMKLGKDGKTSASVRGKNGLLKQDNDPHPSHKFGNESNGLFDGEIERTKINESGGERITGRRPDGRPGKFTRTKGHAGDAPTLQFTVLPDIANPGNVIDCGAAGGGHLGSKLAHVNEAPFPEKLAAFYVRSFCPPGGRVFDPFGGSGTTMKVAVANGRKFVTCDLRRSQCELMLRRYGEASVSKGLGFTL
jgi:hypothetical protein